MTWKVVAPAMAALLTLGVPAGLSAQSPRDAVRLIRAETSPHPMPYAAPAEVRVELLVSPGHTVFLPDALGPAQEMDGIGVGRWTTSVLPGDSVAILLHYPVIAYRPELQELPHLPVGVVTRPGDGAAVLRLVDAPAELSDELAMVELPLGTITVGGYEPLEALREGDQVAAPRPPADVLGGEWSLWLILAVGFASAAGAGGLATLLRGWWTAGGGRVLGRLRGATPKQRALRELERIRGLGWHQDGRVADFYDSSTGALRRFAAESDPESSTALTTSQLLSRLETRSGAGRRTDRLADALAAAERAKFGSFRPTAEMAEADWATIRDWIRSTPDT